SWSRRTGRGLDGGGGRGGGGSDPIERAMGGAWSEAQVPLRAAEEDEVDRQRGSQERDAQSGGQRQARRGVFLHFHPSARQCVRPRSRLRKTQLFSLIGFGSRLC